MYENEWKQTNQQTKETITFPIVGKISNKHIWINLTENLNDISEKSNEFLLTNIKKKIWMNEKDITFLNVKT